MRRDTAPQYVPAPEFAPETGADVFRERRDSPPYGAPAPAYHAPVHKKGRVGPVYTFVKTDPKVGGTKNSRNRSRSRSRFKRKRQQRKT